MQPEETLQPVLHLLRQRCQGFAPDIALILGSGLGHLGELLQNRTCISYSEIAAFPQLSVAGHRSELVVGDLFGRQVMLFCGRFHVYQGLTPLQTTLPVRLAASAGCKKIILSCAVGGIADHLQAGDYLLIRDHLNFTGLNPLQGLSPPTFIDLHNCYCCDSFSVLQAEAHKANRQLYPGTLAYMSGPSYETPAEIAALRAMGATAVSMSTIPEAIMARALGMQVAALALVTNKAGGSPDDSLSHQDVLACSTAATESFQQLAATLIKELTSRD
ncbi:MAG: purine-nucleoside phosphorylase [Geopsychrobacter sp.]|nr:purine-nucleoside phosphorylase [Geopsychrobacter sp.]